MRREIQRQIRHGGCAVAVMAKASAPGVTKTRLSPPLTFEEAAALNTAFLKDIAEKLLQAGLAEPIVPYIAFGPPGAEGFFRAILPDDIALMEIWRPNFGECLWLATTSMLAAGHDSACVLNSDSPTLPSAYLTEAARILAQPGDRGVLGPSTDGGYYLLGLKEAHRRMFEDIAWSTEAVAEQTLERAREIGLEMHILPTWYDVDDADGLRSVVADLKLDGSSDGGHEAAYHAGATAHTLRQLDRESGLFSRLKMASSRPAGSTVRPADGVSV
jgi:rSAM/selenodomain-associated transferase 1